MFVYFQERDRERERERASERRRKQSPVWERITEGAWRGKQLSKKRQTKTAHTHEDKQGGACDFRPDMAATPLALHSLVAREGLDWILRKIMQNNED